MQIKSTEDFGKVVREMRKKAGLTQYQLASASATGERFIRDLEKGKATCQIGKAFLVAAMLGIKFNAELP